MHLKQISYHMSTLGLPSGSAVKHPPALLELQEVWVGFLGREDPLEEGIATYSSILAWRIQWTEELGRLQSCGRKELDMTDVTWHARTHGNFTEEIKSGGSEWRMPRFVGHVSSGGLYDSEQSP